MAKVFSGSASWYNGYPNCSTGLGAYRMKCPIVYSSMTMGTVWKTENGNGRETISLETTLFICTPCR
jgi:hypothetical protein